jgi:hypothetical protein
MTIRVGRITRNEDVHGISGTGEPAEVVEFSDGSIAVRWLGKDASTNVTNNIKNVVNVHGHAGKSEVEWLWEEPTPRDPMEEIFDKKIIEAGGSTAGPGVDIGPTGPYAEAEAEAAKDAEAEAIAEEIVEEAQEMTERVASKVADKLAQDTAEKVAKKAAETVEKVEDASE